MFWLCQPDLLTVCTQALDERLHQMSVVAALAPAGQLPVGNDHDASRFVQQHDRVIKEHQLFVAQTRIHHIVYDDQRTAEPVFVSLQLFVNVIFGFQRIKETLDRVVADLEICRKGLPAKMTGQRCFACAAFADDEQVLIVIDPVESLQMLNLPLDATVELARQILFFGKPTVVLKPNIPRTSL